MSRTTMAGRLRRAGSMVAFVAAVAGVSAAAPAEAQNASAMQILPVKEVQIGGTRFTRGEPVPDWVETAPVPVATQRAPVAIRLADTQFLAAATPVIYVHRATQVNDAAAMSEIGQYAISFAPDYQRLQLHSVRILRGDAALDMLPTVQVRFIQREVGLEQGVYSGIVTALLLVQDVRVGDTLDIVYTLHGANPVLGGRFVDAASWDQIAPVARRRVILNVPAGRDVAWKLIGPPGARLAEPQTATRKGMRTTRWEEEAIPALQPEPLAPRDVQQVRWLQFSEYNSWRDVARWADGLFQLQPATDGELMKVVDVLKREPTPAAQVAAALRYVQTEVRYFSLALGESSHRPTQPSLVLQRRYGDCKDKSFLLIALLKALGIDARPVLVAFGTRRGLDALLPSPFLFDHVIVDATVNGEHHYLDATRLGQSGGLASFGQLHAGAQVLLVGPDTQGLTQIPIAANGPEGNSVVEEQVRVAKLGEEAEITAQEHYNGLDAEFARLMSSRLTAEQRLTAARSAAEHRFPGATVIGDPVITDDTERNQVTWTVRLKAPKFATQSGDQWMARFPAVGFSGVVAIPPTATRRTPLAIPRYPYEARYTVRVEWPDEVSATRDPQVLHIESKYLEYEVKRSFRGRVATHEVRLKSLADRVPPEDVPQWLEDLQKASRALTVLMILGKDDMKSTGLFGLGRKDFKDSLKTRYDERLAQISRTIAGGKLPSDDLSTAYCDRASIHAGFERLAEAQADIREALKLAPNSPAAYRCRGEIDFAAKDFQKSAAAYGQALTLGDTSADLYYHRGRARFYMGQLEEAAEDFSRTANAKTEDASAGVYASLWWAWTLKRLQRPLPPVLAQRAAEQPRGEWPRPALAMLAGLLTPDEVIALVQQKSGDDREMAEAEAYFYVGQYYLAQGDRARARSAFEQCRAKGVFIYAEHTAAKFELERLSTP